MSDLLDRLVARGRGMAVTVGPRLPALFEGESGPHAAVPAAEADAIFQPAATRDEPPRRDTRVPPMPVAGRAVRPVQRMPEAERLSERIETHHTVVRVSGTRAAPGPPPVPAADAAPPPGPTAEAPRRRSEPTMTPPPADPGIPARSRRDAPAAPAGAIPRPPPAAPEATISAAPTLAAPPPPEVVSPPPTLTAPPRVEVRIGRIEVRAAPAQPPAAPARPRQRTPRAPRTSLDDYLRRRREQ